MQPVGQIVKTATKIVKTATKIVKTATMTTVMSTNRMDSGRFDSQCAVCSGVHTRAQANNIKSLGGWLAAGTMPTSLYRVPFFYLFLACSLCYYSFLFVVFVLFLFCFCFVFVLSLELCRCSSDLFLSSRPRTGLATTYITGYG